ncbi:hypothetical protein EDD15DRAFT_2177263 [Pisolithus albus]|nr:hypothetical protein EDD15DRAFT_2177263 [Pisolithus albus]
MRSVGLPTEGLHQATVGVGGTAANSARDAPALDRLSGLSTAAGDSPQVRNTEAAERTRESLTPDTCLSGLSTGAGGPPQVHNTEAADRTRGPLAPDPRVSGLSTGAGGPPQVLNDASWKSRNPGMPVIPPRSSEKLDTAQRAARKAAAEQRRVKQQAVADAVAELLEEQEVRINEIAKAHSVLPEKVRLLITGETHYRKRHLPCGQKFQLKELQEMVANDPDMQNLDEETKQKYLGELKESRSCKAIGVRSTNTAASRDVQATLKKTYGELQALAYRTGIYACLFVTRGHVYDMHAATWFGTDNIMDFWEDRMKLSPDYIVKQLELWACNEEKSSITKHLRQEKPVRLRFANFEQIKYKFGIDYEGWPEGIPFSSPYKLQTIDEIRRLRDAIRDDSFRWVKMSSSQHHEYRKQVDARREAGETVGVPRQGRSDKGKKRKALNDENAPRASKKARRGRAQTTPKSREVITTSDEEDGEEYA